MESILSWPATPPGNVVCPSVIITIHSDMPLKRFFFSQQVLIENNFLVTGWDIGFTCKVLVLGLKPAVALSVSSNQD